MRTCCWKLWDGRSCQVNPALSSATYRHNLDGKEYAIKSILPHGETNNDEEIKDEFERRKNEVEQMCALSHENIVAYHSSWVFDVREICPHSIPGAPFDSNGVLRWWVSSHGHGEKHLQRPH